MHSIFTPGQRSIVNSTNNDPSNVPLEKISDVRIFDQIFIIDWSCVCHWNWVFDESSLEIIRTIFMIVVFFVFWFAGKSKFFLESFIAVLGLCFLWRISFGLVCCLRLTLLWFLDLCLLLRCEVFRLWLYFRADIYGWLRVGNRHKVILGQFDFLFGLWFWDETDLLVKIVDQSAGWVSDKFFWGTI